MREDNLLAMRKKPFIPRTTDSRHCFLVAPNRIRGLVPTGPTRSGSPTSPTSAAKSFVFLAAVLDAFSRRAIGWALQDHLRAELCLEALDMAIAARKPRPEASSTTPTAASNTPAAITRAASTHRIPSSMSRRGNPYDNAKAESFMKTLKKEEVYVQDYRTIEEARTSIARFLETLQHKTPALFTGLPTPC